MTASCRRRRLCRVRVPLSEGDQGLWPVGRVLDDAGVEGLVAALERYAADASLWEAPLEFQYEPHGGGVRKMRCLAVADPDTWSRLWRNEPTQALLAARCTEPFGVVFSAAFLKPPGGSRTPFHQDQALWSRPLPGAFSCWTALDGADDQNGCLQLCPGSHRLGALAHVTPPDTSHPEVAPEALAGLRRRHVPLPPGHAVAWDRFTVHGSGANTSGRPRRGVVVVVAPMRLLDPTVPVAYDPDSVR